MSTQPLPIAQEPQPSDPRPWGVWPRKRTRTVMVGTVPVGGDAPIAVQSMCDTDTRDISATVKQIHDMEEAGCEIVRVAVPDKEAGEAIARIKPQISIPLVADIHFDWRLAILAAEMGADKLRINPGNIGGKAKIAEVVACARDYGLPIRVGVNQGSIEKDLLDKYGGNNPDSLVESALRNAEIIAEHGFDDIILSLKSSNVGEMMAAYRSVAEKCDYPLHLGVTEAGPVASGTLKTAVAFGALISEGIGDTIRVSLTGDKAAEINAGFDILQALGLRRRGPELVSCPSCGRIEIDLMSLVDEVQQTLKGITTPLKVAVMGCVVNGPGEARDADWGIFGGKGVYLLTRKGEIVERFTDREAAKAALTRVLRDSQITDQEPVA
ncbi:MAG: flavodoxin-dependent (E)-4-hydroxy-3-methylbut-2-enyl-diphosphate synthase [candidate division Zixibacteria bacterium]|nr:flavodoxin-dependent (E)-4-hydroxy-3-methylbut-2-enyl-diphosphate synthase [candidate division Zixibacteria bacterium]